LRGPYRAAFLCAKQECDPCVYESVCGYHEIRRLGEYSGFFRIIYIGEVRSQPMNSISPSCVQILDNSGCPVGSAGWPHEQILRFPNGWVSAPGIHSDVWWAGRGDRCAHAQRERRISGQIEDSADGPYFRPGSEGSGLRRILSGCPNCNSCVRSVRGTLVPENAGRKIWRSNSCCVCGREHRRFRQWECHFCSPVFRRFYRSEESVDVSHELSASRAGSGQDGH
jgi:hypothetical protein